jgi:nicotinamide-nucleotide amidase
MPSVEIVTVGTELLLGDLVDTNGPYVARALADSGIDVFAKHSVGDNRERLAQMLRGALERADGVVTTGGLGPTIDDITREAVADAVDAPLELHEPSVGAIERRLARFGRTGPLSENNLRQAFLPHGAFVLENPNGSAPGFVALRADGRFVASMPGVPSEMRAMIGERLLPWLALRFGVETAIYRRTLHLIGIAESDLDQRIDDLFRNSENPKLAVLAHSGRVDVKIMAKAHDAVSAERAIAPLERELRERLGDLIFAVDDGTLESTVVRALAERGWTLALAESVTGGDVAGAIVGVAGASEVLRGAIVAYANDVKSSLLDIAPELLAEHGAVSEQVATAMAHGARRRLGADIAVATTGIAGPSGGTADKPVGLVWFAIVTAADATTHRIVVPGSREDVRGRAVAVALNLLRGQLMKLG